jgi:predicted ATPase/DNA-binding SARP family transcriptional activator
MEMSTDCQTTVNRAKSGRNDMKISLYLFGIPRLEIDGQNHKLPTNRVLALLAYLILEADRPHPRTHLIELLWDDKPENFRKEGIYHLNKLLGEWRNVCLTVDEGLIPAVTFHHHPDFQVDVVDFLGTPSTSITELDTLYAFVNLYQGEFLMGLGAVGSQAFEDWLYLQRLKCQQQAMRFCQALIDQLISRQNHQEALLYAQQLLDLDLLNEQAYRNLMLIYRNIGDRNAVRHHYQRCVEVFAQELDEEPEPETQALYQELMATSRWQTNLPAQTTAFIGRDTEIKLLKNLLNDTRLLTLTGPGGIGKTGLALQLAAKVIDDFDNGVFFIPLAGISDPKLAADSIAITLGIHKVGGQSLIKALQAYLAKKQLLLVLDGFEQIVAAAPVISELLMAAPMLKILVTSRELLHIYGEQNYLVPPMELESTSMAMVMENEAVRLLLQRAQMSNPNLSVSEANECILAQICIRLEGFPLALELAAGWLRVFSPAELLERLDQRLNLLRGGARNLPLRQQTMRDTITWSFSLLNENERILFARLGVFVGCWSMQAAEAICPDFAVPLLDSLVSLVDKSLVVQKEGINGEMRFSMFETIREYALEVLSSNGEMPLVCREHANYFCTLVEQMNAFEHGEVTPNWADLLEQDHGNIRAALDWSIRHGEAHLAYQIVGAMNWFWWMRDRFREAYDWAGRVLRLEGQISSQARARVLLTSGQMACSLGAYDEARVTLAEALSLSRESSVSSTLGWILELLANITSKDDDYVPNWEYALESLAVFRQINHESGISIVLNSLGQMAYLQEDYQQAKEYLEEAVALSRKANNLGPVKLLNLAEVLSSLHEDEKASALIAEAFDLAHQFRSEMLFAACLRTLAIVLSTTPQPEQAARLFGAAEIIREKYNIPIEPIDKPRYQAAVAALASRLSQTGIQTAWLEGRKLSPQELRNWSEKNIPEILSQVGAGTR